MRKIVFFTLVVLSIGCVSQRKYSDLENRWNQLITENERLRQIESEYLKTQVDLSTKETELSYTNQSLSDLQDRQNRLNTQYNELLKKYDGLISQNNQLILATSQEKSLLNEQIGNLQNELTDRQNEVRDLQLSLENQINRVSILEKGLGERDSRIIGLTAQLDQQQARMDSLKSSLTDAMIGFSSEELSIEEKDGKVYVSLSQELLFQKGSTIIDQKGRDAIVRVAEILRTAPDIDIMVEGHTDSDGDEMLNWDLSVERATAVVKILTEHYVDPTRITAAGRSFYDPIVDNDSEPNKSLNRRTEIILTPRLNAIMQIIKS